MQHRQQQTGGSIPRSTASAAPSSASSSTTGTWHPCIESDMYHIVNRHAASPETVEKRRAILATLQEATGSITAWKVIDVSPWTYSFETEESVLQVALAQPYDPLSGETAAATPPEHRQKKRPSRKSPNLRPLESVLQGISPFLQIPTDSETRLPDPVECTIEGIEFDLLPPSPLHAPLNAFLNAYRWHYQPLHALLPFFDLWVRSWDVEPGELSPACLALLVLTYLGWEYEMRDLMSWMEHNPTRRSVAHHGSDFLEAAERGNLKSYRLSDRLSRAPVGEIIHGFFKFLNDPKLTKRVLSMMAPASLQREEYESSNPNPPATKPPLFVLDVFLPFHNHAANLSWSTWHRLQAAAKYTVTELESTAPLHCIFGEAVEVLQASTPAQRFSDPLIEVAIGQMIMAQAPDDSIRAARQRTIHRVDQVIRSAFGENYPVQCFGSTQYGVDSATSDLDMIILDRELARGWHPSVKSDELPAVYNMKKVGWALQDGGFQRVIAITGATVPIVKFYDPRTRLNIDLNCNNALGCVNTVLLANYCNAWAPLRSMIFFIKKWAKSWAFNDAAGQDGPSSYSSYCLTLMIVSFLQIRGVLPNLQSCAVGQLDKGTAGFWSKLKKDKRVWSDTRFESLDVILKRGWTGRSMTLSEAIYAWFRFFAYEFKYETHVLDIKKNGLDRRQQPMLEEKEPKAQNQGKAADDKLTLRTDAQGIAEDDDVALANDVNDVAAVDPAAGVQPEDWRKSKLVVVDPFLTAKNCANGVSQRVNERFVQECQRAVFLLEAGQSVDKLLGEKLPLFPGEGKPRRPPLRYLQPRKRKGNAQKQASTQSSVSQHSTGVMQQHSVSQHSTGIMSSVSQHSAGVMQASTASGFPDPAAAPMSFPEFLERMRLNHSATNGGGVRRQPPSPTPSHQPKLVSDQVNDVYYPTIPWTTTKGSQVADRSNLASEASSVSMLHNAIQWQSSIGRYSSSASPDKAKLGGLGLVDDVYDPRLLSQGPRFAKRSRPGQGGRTASFM